MKLLDIAFRSSRGAPMQTTEQVTVNAESGLEGDIRRRPGKRQVTILSKQQWQDACDALNLSEIPWTVRRANFLVDGIICNENLVGNIVQLGSVKLQITGETDPCHKMDEQVPGLRKALTPAWRGGVTCRILQGGEVRVGDSVEVVPAS
ncbi:MOSC domain-containing protein [Aestuariibacter salexigens]|uniref:MOSC domain-containing protein n=1 Tax=Aestuariibacter salexigens TaxID=226010 RepID=UPI00041790D7|nr:MOSC domain-containing protein [Aestuariibacter salexigens]